MLSNEIQRRQNPENKKLMLRQNALMGWYVCISLQLVRPGILFKFLIVATNGLQQNHFACHLATYPVLWENIFDKMYKIHAHVFISGFTWTGNLRGPILSENYHGIQRRKLSRYLFLEQNQSDTCNFRSMIMMPLLIMMIFCIDNDDFLHVMVFNPTI